MRLSIRDRLDATIAGGRAVTAAITKDAAEDLAPASGDDVTVLVKATEVSIAVE